MQNNNGISILVVDDNQSHYEIVSRMIRKSSLKISTIMNCDSYQKSQETLNEITPDIVLLDYKLPDSSDLELISFMMC